MLRSLICVFFVSTCVHSSAYADEREVVLEAMQAELDRSMKSLKIEQYEAPYFIGYRIVEENRASVSGSFGGLVGDTASQRRRAVVDVRVGDYAFDSSLEADDSGGDYDAFSPSHMVPLTSDIEGIRGTLWLLTDKSYKEAVSAYLRKKAKRVTKVKKVHVDSFSQEQPNRFVSTQLEPVVDREKWRTLAVALSSRFKACLLYTSPSPRDATLSRMPSSA